MRLLLDTHAFLWFILADPRLSTTALALITDPLNHKHVSPASYWEIAIKIRLGKYKLSAPFEPFMSDQIARNRFTILPITVEHAAVLTALPLHHRDPFDRMLIAQTKVEAMRIVSIDSALDAYGVNRLW